MTETLTSRGPQAPTEQQPPVQDYWGVDTFDRWYLPDGVQYFDFKIMNEGEKSRFEKLTNQDLIVNQDRSARMRVDQTEARHQLIKVSVTGWNLYQGGLVVDFNKHVLEKWLDVADPKLVGELEFAIRMANPWMQSEMTVEEIDKEIDRLEQIKRQLKDKDLGEADSATR